MKLCMTAALALIATAGLAVAEPRPTPIRGEIDSYAPGQLRVISRAGEAIDIKTPEDLQIVSLLPKTVSDITVGNAVNTTTVPDGNGGLTALQVSILPPGAGLQTGQRPSDVAPDSVMTTATISGVAAATGGDQLTMTYDDQTVTVNVPLLTRFCAS